MRSLGEVIDHIDKAHASQDWSMILQLRERFVQMKQQNDTDRRSYQPIETEGEQAQDDPNDDSGVADDVEDLTDDEVQAQIDAGIAAAVATVRKTRKATNSA